MEPGRPVAETLPARSGPGSAGEAAHPDIMLLLRRGTAAAHQRFEDSLDLMSPSLTLERYRDVLRTMFAFYAVLEPRLDAVLGREGAPVRDWPQRRKLPRLRRDLMSLGVDDDALAVLPAPYVPPIRDDAAALGAVYVVEGATLGGRLIARHLAGTAIPASATSFFDPYGADLGRRWHQIRVSLRAWAAADGDSDRAVACVTGAVAVFEAIEGALAASSPR